MKKIMEEQPWLAPWHFFQFGTERGGRGTKPHFPDTNSPCAKTSRIKGAKEFLTTSQKRRIIAAHDIAAKCVLREALKKLVKFRKKSFIRVGGPKDLIFGGVW